MKVILVSGKLQSGKNTFTDFLIDEVKKTNTIDFEFFAKPLKDECKDVFQNLTNYLNGISTRFNIPELSTTNEQWYENKNEITRLLLQIYGTEIFRNKVDTDWWAKKLKDRVLQRKEDFIVITDVRFKSEINILDTLEHDHNIELVKIRIERTNYTRDDNPIHTHQSEIDLDDYKYWDYVIKNDTTLDVLKSNAIQVSKEIM